MPARSSRRFATAVTPPCAPRTPASAAASREPADAPALTVPAARLRDARDRLPRDLRAGLERMADEHRALPRGPGPAARAMGRGRAGHPRGTGLARARPRRRLRAGRDGRVSVVAAHERRSRPAWPGVGAYVVASPAAADGSLSPALLGAAGLMEVDELVVAGGAQAIGALAYGTESVARVDKIVGPGNAWVTAAKLEVLGTLRDRHARRPDRGPGRRRRQRGPGPRRGRPAQPGRARRRLPCPARDAVGRPGRRGRARGRAPAAEPAAPGHPRGVTGVCRDRRDRGQISTTRSTSPTSTRPST